VPGPSSVGGDPVRFASSPQGTCRAPRQPAVARVREGALEGRVAGRALLRARNGGGRRVGSVELGRVEAARRGVIPSLTPEENTRARGTLTRLTPHSRPKKRPTMKSRARGEAARRPCTIAEWPPVGPAQDADSAVMGPK